MYRMLHNSKKHKRGINNTTRDYEAKKKILNFGKFYLKFYYFYP